MARRGGRAVRFHFHKRTRGKKKVTKKPGPLVGLWGGTEWGGGKNGKGDKTVAEMLL